MNLRNAIRGLMGRSTLYVTEAERAHRRKVEKLSRTAARVPAAVKAKRKRASR